MNPEKATKEIDASKVGCSKAARAMAEGIVARIKAHHERDMPEFINNTLSHFGKIEGYIDCAKESGQLVSATVHIVERSITGRILTNKMPVKLEEISKINPFSEDLPPVQNTQQPPCKANSQSRTTPKKVISSITTSETKSENAPPVFPAKTTRTESSINPEVANDEEATQTLL